MNSVLAPPPVRTRRAEPAVRQAYPTHPPRSLQWVSGLVVVAGVTMCVIGAWKTGTTWDEPHHVMRLRNFLDHGWYALDWSLGGDAGSGSGPGYAENNTAVYAPVAALLLHGLAALLGVEGWGSVASTPAAYDVRHLGVVLIGLAGTAAAAAITRILLGSWRWALVTAAALLALPMWTGHLMFNIKDVPVATGYTIVTLSLISMVAPVQGQRTLRVGGLAAGIVLMVGTRPAMVTAVLTGLLVLAAGVLVAGRFGNARTALAEAAVGVAAAGAVLVLVYPNLFTHPMQLLQSAEQSSSFRGGRDANLGYIPFFVASQVPLLLLAFFAVGLATAFGFVRRQWRTDTSQATRLALVVAQLLALPLIAFAKQSDLYNALRQLLFATPAWAVLTTIGFARLLTWARTRARARVAGGLALVALVAPVVDQALLFPYQYTYFNVAMDATGVHVPSDYWRASVPELIPDLPTDGQIVCGPSRSSPLDAFASLEQMAEVPQDAKRAGRYSSDSSVDCRTDPLGPLASTWASDGLPLDDDLPHDEFYAIIDRDHPLPTNCTRLADVTRNRHGREIRMTYVARCHLEPELLGPEPVAFTEAPADGNMVPALWVYVPEGWVKRTSWTAIDAGGTEASLTFTTPRACAEQACTLVLDADATSDLDAVVNGDRVQLAVSASSVVVHLSPGTEKTWVTFNRSSGAPLDLSVRSIRVVPAEKKS